MFTGIIAQVCAIQSIQSSSSKKYFILDLHPLSSQIQLGDSVAIHGVCLTATEKSSSCVTFEAVQETLNLTNFHQLHPGSWVNVELALRLQDRLGGHLVSGHIDGTGILSRLEFLSHQGELEVRVSDELSRHCLHKGSICINGVSLTLTAICPPFIRCALVQHTIENTCFRHQKVGDIVNIELDMIGKWISHYLHAQGAPLSSKTSLNLEFLQEHGFFP
jgi:riboflavin synthase